MVKGSAKQEKQNYGVLVSNMVERYCQSENDHESIFHLYELYPNCLPWELLSCYSLIFFSFQHNIMPLHAFSIDITLGCLLLLVHAGISLSTALVEIFPVLLIRCPIFLHCE